MPTIGPREDFYRNDNTEPMIGIRAQIREQMSKKLSEELPSVL
jgi:hypothetical protein